MQPPSKWATPTVDPIDLRRRRERRYVTDGWVDNSLRGTIICLVLALLILMMAGCCPYSDHVSVKAIKPALDKVIPRHDKYVQEDPNLMEIERRLQLRTTEELRGVVDQATR